MSIADYTSIADPKYQTPGADGVVFDAHLKEDGQARAYVSVSEIVGMARLVEQDGRTIGDLTKEDVTAASAAAYREWLGVRAACIAARPSTEDSWELTRETWRKKRELLAAIRALTDPSRIAMLHSEIAAKR